MTTEPAAPASSTTSPQPIRPTPSIADGERKALERLIAIAKGDTGQSRRVANFLLAWWNAEECGGFDLVHMWNVDHEILEDMAHVLSLIIRTRSYPDTLGYGLPFEQLAETWHPRLAKGGAQ